jgi:undecaprenyl-diphosphatase
MGWPDPGLAFDVALHLGTLVALLIYFRVEWIALIGSAIGLLRGDTKSPDAKMAMLIIAATIPGGLAGALFEHKVEDAFRAPWLIASMLIAMALVLVVSEWVGRRKKHLKELSWGDAITVGLAQAFAVIPGVSRSGSTITAGLFLNMTRETAARFSFYLSAPIIAGAVAKKTIDILRSGLGLEQLTPFIVGVISSGIVGYIAIAFLMRYLQTHNTYLFVFYRILLGVVVLLAFWLGFR